MDSSEAGRQLIDGRFELGDPLGSGGMGTVWRARDIALHRDVALKEVRPPDPATAAAQPGLAVQLRERAVREARALARLAHPNVVTIHHIVEPADGAEGHPWIVMELVKGGSLHDRLAAGPMPVADVLRIGLDVLSALRAAHAEGVLHRDVKPANVLLRTDGSAVLTDFGIAALHGATGLTSTGVLIGSPEYIAPERARGEEGLAASDLWSLGMLLYVASEGVHPLRRATSLATVVAVLDEPIPAPVRSGPLGPVLERLLVRDLSARPDAEQLEALLRSASSALGGATPVVPPIALGQFGPAAPADRPTPTSTCLLYPSGLGQGGRLEVLDEGDQDVLARLAGARVAEHQRDGGREVEGGADLLRGVLGSAEVVAGHDEGRAVVFEPVDGVPGVGEAPGVDEDDGAEGAGEEPVPQEPEPLLAGGAEQVEHVVGVEGDAAEVEGHGGGVLPGDPGDPVDVVDRLAGLGHRLFGVQRADLADRADHRGLADAETAHDDDLQSVVGGAAQRGARPERFGRVGRRRVGDRRVRDCGVQRAPAPGCRGREGCKPSSRYAGGGR
ncbi:serine/threonine protein kinase [Streptomyces sp. ICC4]|nr:serine/threonine protein kinase [Streptomyces sp. ICC4]